jgi:hypothetical protein
MENLTEKATQRRADIFQKKKAREDLEKRENLAEGAFYSDNRYFMPDRPFLKTEVSDYELETGIAAPDTPASASDSDEDKLALSELLTKPLEPVATQSHAMTPPVAGPSHQSSAKSKPAASHEVIDVDADYIGPSQSSSGPHAATPRPKRSLIPNHWKSGVDEAEDIPCPFNFAKFK